HQDEAVWVSECINLNESKGMQECVGASQRMNISRDSTPPPQTGDAPNTEIIPHIKLAQANLARSKNATSEMYSLVQKQRLDVLLIQEPYARATGTSYIVGGLGIGAQVSATSLEQPWAAV
ncbi:hypothetical protein PV328_012232, partial [Microctonus aethiopoides]